MPVLDNVQHLPIDQLIAHPFNSNQMPVELFHKLSAHLKETGRYPPLVVRTLEKSDDFKSDLGKYQILDGHNRWEALKKLGEPTVVCIVWPGLNDAASLVYLATLNRLEGEDSPEKRQALLREIQSRLDIDDAALARLLPESMEAITQYLETDEDLEKQRTEASAAAAAASVNEMLTIFCTQGDRDTIKTAMKTWLDENDPDRELPLREGSALAALVS